MTITIKIDSKAEYRGKNEYYKRKEYEGEAGKYKISGDAWLFLTKIIFPKEEKSEWKAMSQLPASKEAGMCAQDAHRKS